jgi:deoxyadenosine/deoxycytidine kinase
MKHIPIIISVKGLIGSGKTVLINECLEPLLTKGGYRVKFIKEPVDEWTEILPLFYKDPKKYSYHFQIKLKLKLNIFL